MGGPKWKLHSNSVLKKKKKKQVFSEIKVLFKLKCQPSTLPVLPLEFFCSHIFRFYTFLSSEDIIKRLKHVCIAVHSLGMLEMFICNLFVFSKKEIACLGESTSERYSAKMNMSATVFRAWGCPQRFFSCPQRWLRKMFWQMHSRIREPFKNYLADLKVFGQDDFPWRGGGVARQFR